MFPNSSRFNIKAPNVSQQQSNRTANPSLSSLDSNQLLMAANSLRSLFGDNINENMFQTIRENPSTNRVDTELAQMSSTQRTPERKVIDYPNQHYSRLDRNSLNQMSANLSRNTQQFDDSPPLRTESHFFDPTKMPQKSILKKSKDQSFESSNFRSVEDEDIYIYGSSISASMPTHSSGPSSGGLPPGIVQMEEQRSTRSPPHIERVLSPISLRLKREMENMDRRVISTEPKDDNHWTQRHGVLADDSLNRNNDWEEEEVYQRRFRQHMNPSPTREDDLSLERVRIQQMAAIEAGILKQTEKQKRSFVSPNSPLRQSTGYRRQSSERSPKRLRRSRSRSRSPRRRSISPRRRSISPRFRSRRSRSPSRDRYRRSRSRSRSGGRSDSRGRTRRRSRSPDRRRSSRSPNALVSRMNSMNEFTPNLMNPMAPIIPMGAQGFNLPFVRQPDFLPLVGAPVGPLMDHYMPQMMSYPQVMPQMQRNVAPKPNSRLTNPNLKNIPLVKATTAQPSAKKEVPKKEDKLINPKDLLIAERAKLREELEALKKQCEKKIEEQGIIVAKDGGSDSYAYRQLDKVIKELKTAIDLTHNKLSKNFQLINDVQKSKTKEKDFMKKLKTTGDISKVEPKKKLTVSPKVVNQSPKKPNTSTEKKTVNVKQKDEKKETINEEEEEEKNSRFHYFDLGPHWCKSCDKFLDNMKQYFTHIHTKEHLSKHKESDRTPWITKDYIKEMEKQVVKTKNQLVVASKGIQFIHPMQGFYCDLCKQFLNDSYEAQKHFKTAKHNRSYTRYTLLHNDYENKWKSDRDKAFTELKKKEREVEKENSKKEHEEKIKQRKKLEDEVKRKDKEVKEKIEAMNKSLKTVKELEEPKANDEKKDDKTKSSAKIRLNLNSNKTESNDKSKKSDKNSDKTIKSTETETKSKEKTENVVKPKEKTTTIESIVSETKPKDKISDKNEMIGKSKEKNIENKEKPKAKTENDSKSNETENSDDIEDMLVIDEINCDSQDNEMEDKDSDEVIDENQLLYPENSENNTNAVQKSDSIEENIIQKKDKIVQKISENIGNTSSAVEPKESKGLVENNSENNGNQTISDEIEGVMPEMEAMDTNNERNSTSNENSETVVKSVDESNKSYGLDDKSMENNGNDSKVTELSETIDQNKSVESNETDNQLSNPNNKSIETFGKDSTITSDSNIPNVKSNDKQIANEEVVADMKNSSNGIESKNENIKTEKMDLKSEANFDLDLDIAKLNERFDSMVKQEVKPELEGDEEDELDGFDVIDSVNDETQEVIDLSD